jgi:hypothetical protein
MPWAAGLVPFGLLGQSYVAVHPNLIVGLEDDAAVAVPEVIEHSEARFQAVSKPHHQTELHLHAYCAQGM